MTKIYKYIFILSLLVILLSLESQAQKKEHINKEKFDAANLLIEDHLFEKAMELWIELVEENPENSNMGSAGKEEWQFNTLKNGTSNIKLQYSRPWEGGEKGEWSLNITVVVD